MEKESYSIDDILSEVKKRRAEIEEPNDDFEIKFRTGENANTEKVEEKPFDTVTERTSEGEQSFIVEPKEKEIIEEDNDEIFSEEVEVISEEEFIENIPDDIPKYDDSNNEPETEIYVRSKDGVIDKGLEEPLVIEFDDVIVRGNDGEILDEPEAEGLPVELTETLVDKANEEAVEVADDVSSEEENDDMQETESEEADSTDDALIDLLAFSNSKAPENVIETSADEKPKKEKFFKTKKGKRLKKIIIILLVLLLIVAGVGVWYVYNSLNSMTDNEEKSQDQQWKGMSQLIENFPEIKETEATELSSLQDMIKTWYYNGAPCSSTHVLNVLLIGEDTRGSDILEDDTRADSAIIASFNIDTKEITLTSILRDAYAYWENTSGDADSGIFEKINGAMSIGDVHTYIECVEKLYKIDIDNYVIVNFDSFEKIIDEIGGVTLELTTAEINEINNHPKRYGYVTIDKSFDGYSGEMLLDGKQALAYCRIRKIDSDNARADRQKTCLTEMFNKVKDSSAVTLLKVVNTLIPYVKTGFSNSEVVSIAKYALSQGWLGFDIQTTSVPYNRINEKGVGGIYYGAWCWRPDYPDDAYYLQTLIYGKSSITLAQERVDVIRCNDYGFYSETLTPCYATIHNYSYGEVTTYEFQKQEEETPTSN